MSAADTTAPPITPFEFQREHDGSLSLETAVYQALGRASTCWESMEGTGVFDDAAARGVGQALLAHIAATAPKPTAIRVYRTSNNGGWSWCFEADNTADVPRGWDRLDEAVAALHAAYPGTELRISES